jgi:hypothetical protein
MTQQDALNRLQRQIAMIDDLNRGSSYSPEFKKWHRNTEVLIEKIFGGNTRHTREFSIIHYIPLLTGVPDYEEDARAYQDGIDSARAILQSFIQEVEEYWESEKENTAPRNALSDVGHICLRFHAVASQLKSRHNNRNTLKIEDEYDVQDLLHALLRLYFDDVRAEEWTPSYAGGCSRVDFLLKAEQVVIEVKKTRKGLAAKEIGDQLLIDIQRYQAHPDCKTLVCFVYDPEGRIANPRGIEADLNKQHGSMPVEVIIAPRNI